MENLSDKNIRLNLEEINQKKTFLKSLPRSLNVTLTSRCNLGCRMCPVYRKKWELPEKTYDDIISILPYLKCTTWQGGEAFLYPRFGDLLEEIHSKYPYIEQTMYTNALLIDDEWLRRLSGSPKIFFISLDAPEKNLYEKIQRGGTFKEFQERLEKIVSFRDRSPHKVEIYINAVIMRSNYRFVEDFVSFGKKYSVDKIEFSPVIGPPTPENIFNPIDEEALKFLKGAFSEIIESGREAGIEIFSRLPFDDDLICDKNPNENTTGELFCTLPWTFMFILAGGKVIPHGSCKKVVGNVTHQTIREIWNSPSMIEYREKLIANDIRELCGARLNWMELI